ncbi:hypothetical protein SCHPADRAFT_908338 [Schizopora paradoxa]|uniref:Zn(2)-C6 fungal-type domain-containing protein n=1 Tax=Schizopora paradoxa TaxID=27342 RepID=A0A0H2RAB2_9AGAM|nr:hypothetical protein SCHPADRAFT_908338 [Schizopora paradoxa]
MSKRGAAHASNASAQAAASGGASSSAHAHSHNNSHSHSSASPVAAGKQKGAQRAKSGCYTCRIRRKKCDEKQDAEGNCQTCVRLRLQCLGFGAKRPDWMREGNSVPELRERIKNFLAEQGMIKGHSSTAPRTLIQPVPTAANTNTNANNTHPPAPPSSNGSATPTQAGLTLGNDPIPQAVYDSAAGNDGRHHQQDGSVGVGEMRGSPPAPGGSPPAEPILVLNNHQHQHAHAQQQHPAAHHAHATHYGHHYMQSDHPSHGTQATAGGNNGNNGNNNVHSSAAGGVHGSPPPSAANARLHLRPGSHSPPVHNGVGHGHHNNVHGHGGHQSYKYGAQRGGAYNTYGGHLSLHNNSPPFHSQQLSPDSPKPPRQPMLSDPPHLLSQYTFAPPPSSSVMGSNGGNNANGGTGGANSWHNQYGPYGSQFTYNPSASSSALRHHHPYFSSGSNNNNSTFTPAGPPQITHFANGSIDHPNAPLLSFEVEQGFPARKAPLESQFSRHYHFNGDDADGDIDMFDAGVGALIPVVDPSLQQSGAQYEYAPIPSLPDPLFVDRDDGALVTHYLRSVRPMQFFLADRSIDDVILRFAMSSDIVRSAICHVASVHRRRLKDSPPMQGNAPLPSSSAMGVGGLSSLAAGFFGGAQPHMGHPQLTLPSITAGGAPLEDEGDEGSGLRIRHALENTSARERLTEAEAMAGLQCISSYLFAGGTGGWDFFLQTACAWVRSILPDSRTLAGAGGYVKALERAGAAGETGETGLKGFIVRTTMWFEVLASVSQVRRPLFLEAYRELFGVQRIMEVDGAGGGGGGEERGFSMLNVMGCDNLTFLAIAETSALAAWKDETQREGRMSLMELTKRGVEIEEKYLREDSTRYHSATGTSGSTTTNSTDGDTVEKRRQLTADIFRAAARLFVHTVLNEDNLACNEIMTGVYETVMALRRVPKTPDSLLNSVVRSVIFPICLAGCMTDDKPSRAFLKDLLVRQQTAGNSTQVLEAMEKVWRQREEKARRAASLSRRSMSDLRSSLGGAGGEESGKSWRDVVRQVLLV